MKKMKHLKIIWNSFCIRFECDLRKTKLWGISSGTERGNGVTLEQLKMPLNRNLKYISAGKIRSIMPRYTGYRSHGSARSKNVTRKRIFFLQSGIP